MSIESAIESLAAAVNNQTQALCLFLKEFSRPDITPVEASAAPATPAKKTTKKTAEALQPPAAPEPTPEPEAPNEETHEARKERLAALRLECRNFYDAGLKGADATDDSRAALKTKLKGLLDKFSAENFGKVSDENLEAFHAEFLS